MRVDELAALCRQAAADLLTREGRPVPAAVVLPAADTTRVLTLPDFPGDDAARHSLLAAVASEQVRARNVACYGFVCEAIAETEGMDVDVVTVVYGARAHHPQVCAALLDGDQLGAFTDAEPLEFEAMPFLAPLQQAVDAAGPPDVMGGP